MEWKLNRLARIDAAAVRSSITARYCTSNSFTFECAPNKGIEEYQAITSSLVVEEYDLKFPASDLSGRNRLC